MAISSKESFCNQQRINETVHTHHLANGIASHLNNKVGFRKQRGNVGAVDLGAVFILMAYAIAEMH